jgi:hypothetical protein
VPGCLVSDDGDRVGARIGVPCGVSRPAELTGRGMRPWRLGSFCSCDGSAARGIKGSGQIGIWMAGQEAPGSIIIDERIVG